MQPDLFRSTPLATFLSRLDDRRVVEVNDAYLHLFGVSREDIVGHLAIDAAPTVTRRRGANVFDEIEVRTNHGLKTLALWSRTLEIDGVAHELSSVIDITERKRDQEAEEANDRRIRELAENIQEVLWLTDPDNTKMLYVSPAYERIFGRSSAALYTNARDWSNAIHPDDRVRMEAFTTVPTTAERREQCRVIDASGTIRTVQIKVYPVRDETGAVVRIAGVAEDISDRLQLEEQVRQTQKMESLGLLAGGIAHDFNNILAVIAANTSLMAESMPEIHPDRELVDEVGSAVRRATALTRQLLAFSRKQVIEPVVLDLNAAVNDTRKMLRRMVGEDVVIATSLEPELGRVKIDPGHLVQVLMNLAVNARDAMPRGGTLTITTRNATTERQVMFAVSDTGSGMTADVMKRVFEPLFTTKGLGKGTGLGLSVVHGIIEQAGGRIDIESEVDIGTTIRVFLPLEDGPAELFVDVVACAAKGTEKVIIVDDDPFVRQAISRTLRTQGYEVFEVSDGDAALQLLRDHGRDIALLVTDVVMPGMDGRELVDSARQRRPSLPVLYMSGYTDDAVLRHGVDRAEVAVLEKPFHGHTLATRVRKLLDVVKPDAVVSGTAVATTITDRSIDDVRGRR